MAEASFRTVQEMLSSNLGRRGEGAIWNAGGYRYEEAAPDASDHHLTTAGGVKLYVLPGGDGWVNFYATGAVTDAADHSGLWDVAVSASRKIYLPPGTWRFNYKSIPAGTKLRGDGDLTVVRPTRAGIRAALTADSKSTSAFLENIEIEGIHFVDDVVGNGGQADNIAYGQVHLLTLHGVRRCVIKNCAFIGFRGDGVYIGSGDIGGQERHNKDVMIFGCLFDGINNKNRNGISVIDCDGLEVTGCTFQNCSYSFAPGAIDLEPNSSWNIIRNISVHHNRFRNVQSACLAVILRLDGIWFDNAPYSIQFTDNQAENCRDGFSIVSVVDPDASTYDAGVEFRGNKIISSRRPFFVHGARGVLISDNKFIGSTHPAELAYGPYRMVGTRVRGNVFNQCAGDNTSGRAAIIVANVDDLEIADNDFVDCGRANGSTGFCLEFVSGYSGANIRIRRNKFLSPTGRTTRAIRASGYTLTASGNADEGNTYGFATVYEFTAPGSRHLTAAPSSGTWDVGNTVYNSDPSTGDAAWVCTSAGTPGTWRAVRLENP